MADPATSRGVRAVEGRVGADPGSSRIARRRPGRGPFAEVPRRDRADTAANWWLFRVAWRLKKENAARAAAGTG
jgi:hypothetical protein